MRHGTDRTAIAVDRQGPWGNPLRLNHDGDRATVLCGHETLLRDNPEMVNEVRWRLAGRSLACWCDPLPCHGWLLFYVANCTEDELENWLLGEPFWTPRMLRYRSVPGAPGCYVRLLGDL